MKRIILFFGAIVLLIHATAQNREIKPVEMESISENLYQILGGRGATGGMYIGDSEVLVIDSKMDKESVDGIYKAVAEITDKPIKWLVNTHSDGDHINGNQFFPKSVTIVAHENCRKEFFHPQRNGSPSRWLDKEMISYVPEVVFEEKMKIYLGSKVVELYYFGVGHTTGDIVVYFPEEKTAFIGDQVFWGRPQLIHSYKGGNSFKHVEAVKKLLLLDVDKFCSGHADIKTKTDVEEHIKLITAFQQKVKNFVKEGKSLEEIKNEFNEDEGRLLETVYNEIINKD